MRIIKYCCCYYYYCYVIISTLSFLDVIIIMFSIVVYIWNNTRYCGKNISQD